MARVRKATQITQAKKWKIGIYIRLSREDKKEEAEQVSKSGRKHSQPQNVVSHHANKQSGISMV